MKAKIKHRFVECPACHGTAPAGCDRCRGSGRVDGDTPIPRMSPEQREEILAAARENRFPKVR